MSLIYIFYWIPPTTKELQNCLLCFFKLNKILPVTFWPYSYSFIILTTVTGILNLKKYYENTSTKTALVIGIFVLFVSVSQLIQCTNSSDGQTKTTGIENEDPITDNANKMLAEGKQTFRFETFGDEAYWTDALQLNKAIAGEKNGGVGAGLSPKAALAAGLKVDMDVIPADVAAAIKAGKVNLDDPLLHSHFYSSMQWWV